MIITATPIVAATASMQPAMNKKQRMSRLIAPAIVAALLFAVVLERSQNSVFKVPPPTSSKNEGAGAVDIRVDATSGSAAVLYDLLLVDEHGKTFVKDAQVRKGSVFTVKWDASSWSEGKLHLLLLGNNGHTIADRRVAERGAQKFSSDYLISFKLWEEYRGGNRLIKELPVEVF